MPSEPTDKDWAAAIALRIADEWHGASDFPEDKELLRKVLADLLEQHPKHRERLIGTGIIEEDYFGSLE